MPRGGHRPGAGRPKGSAKEVWEIGEACEKLWRKECDASRDRAVAEATRHVRWEWRESVPEYGLPPEERKLSREERQAWCDSDEFKEHVENVEEAILHDRAKFRLDGLSPADITDGVFTDTPPRGMSIRYPRPKGPGIEIIAQVAKDRGLKKPRVKRCWAAYRELIARMDKELD